jgi:dTDP-4-dehydrorhamnose 3,5-epimerase
MITLAEYDEIIGVECKALKTFPDDRGFFREIIRSTDPLFSNGEFGQWSHSKMTKNVVKAWHYHHVQTDWWYVPLGQIRTVLYDNRSESPTFRRKMEILMGESSVNSEAVMTCIRIPPGVLHGCKVLSNEAHLFYITSHTYDPNEEGRLPFNSTLVDHDWGPDVIVVENDRRTFVPTSARTLLAP